MVLFAAAITVSCTASVICGLIAFASYRMYVEGTVNAQSQIIHEPWLVQSAKKYLVAACLWAGAAVVLMLLRYRHRRSIRSL